MNDVVHLFPDRLFKAIVSVTPGEGRSFRKSLLSLARYRGLPRASPNVLYDRNYPAIAVLLQLANQLKQMGVITDNDPPYDFLDRWLWHPVHAGLIIQAMCLTPYSTPNEEEEIRNELLLKEKRVLDSRYSFFRLNFEVWNSTPDAAMHPDVPPNGDVARTVRECIMKTFDQFRHRTLVPRYSRKPLGTHAQTQLKRKFSDILPKRSDGQLYQVDLETVRGEKRICLEGGVEMRQRWYPNQLVPRTYFVAGETAYFHSRFVQDFFNRLCDNFPPTNRHSRVNPRRLSCASGKHFLFYDLTTFTSSCINQRDFIRFLARLGADVPVITSSYGEGPSETTLGMVLEEYALYANEFMRWHMTEKDWEGDHGVAGFLGVLGNIASCTFLHGAVLSMLVDSEGDCGCAGDDAVASTDNERRIDRGISTIGDYQEDKVYRLIPEFPPTIQSDCLYLKRRTFLSESGNLAQLHYFQPPSPLHPKYRKDESYSSRYRQELKGQNHEILSRVIASITQSFKSAVRLSEEHLSTARSYLTSFYHSLSLSRTGYVPQLERVQSNAIPFYPSLEALGHFDFREQTIEANFRGFARVVARTVSPDYCPIRLKKGMTFETCFRGHTITTLEKAGILESVRGYSGGVETYTGRRALHRVLEEYTSYEKGRRIRAYYMKDDVPDWAWGGSIVEIEGRILEGEVVTFPWVVSILPFLVHLTGLENLTSPRASGQRRLRL